MINSPASTVLPTTLKPFVPPLAHEPFPLLHALVQQHIIVTRLPCFLLIIIGLIKHDAEVVALVHEYTIAMAAADAVGHGEFEVVAVAVAWGDVLEGQLGGVVEAAAAGAEAYGPFLAHEPVLDLGHGSLIKGARIGLASALKLGPQSLLELIPNLPLSPLLLQPDIGDHSEQ